MPVADYSADYMFFNLGSRDALFWYGFMYPVSGAACLWCLQAMYLSVWRCLSEHLFTHCTRTHTHTHAHTASHRWLPGGAGTAALAPSPLFWHGYATYKPHTSDEHQAAYAMQRLFANHSIQHRSPTQHMRVYGTSHHHFLHHRTPPKQRMRLRVSNPAGEQVFRANWFAVTDARRFTVARGSGQRTRRFCAAGRRRWRTRALLRMTAPAPSLCLLAIHSPAVYIPVARVGPYGAAERLA